MFFEGARRLLESGVSVVPCRPNRSGRTVIEGYPALVSRALVGNRPYKTEKQDAARLKQNRQRLIEACQSTALRSAYGISV